MVRLALVGSVALLSASFASAQVAVRAPFVRVDVGGPGVAVRAPFVNLFVPRIYGPGVGVVGPGGVVYGPGPSPFILGVGPVIQQAPVVQTAPPPLAPVPVNPPMPTVPAPAPTVPAPAQQNQPAGQPNFVPPLPLPEPEFKQVNKDEPEPIKTENVTLEQFARTFEARPGSYNVTIINPITNQPTAVRFVLPEGLPRRITRGAAEVTFEYGPRQFVRIEFDRDGAQVTAR